MITLVSGKSQLNNLKASVEVSLAILEETEAYILRLKEHIPDITEESLNRHLELIWQEIRTILEPHMAEICRNTPYTDMRAVEEKVVNDVAIPTVSVDDIEIGEVTVPHSDKLSREKAYGVSPFGGSILKQLAEADPPRTLAEALEESQGSDWKKLTVPVLGGGKAGSKLLSLAQGDRPSAEVRYIIAKDFARLATVVNDKVPSGKRIGKNLMALARKFTLEEFGEIERLVYEEWGIPQVEVE